MKTDISTGLGLPLWVNHLAFKADPERIAEVKETMEKAGVPVEMDLDHDWCQSVYFKDPNGILIEFCKDTPGIQPDRDKARKMIHQTP